jgi:hypothetical protein
MRSTRRRSAAGGRWREGTLGFLLAAALLGCIDLSTDPDEIVAIEFPLLPAPAMVAGDTLRDTMGAVFPLVARLFDASGNEVAGTPVEFLSRDTTVTIVGGNLVVGDSAADGIARLIASAAGLQSIVRQLEVVPEAPDTLREQGAVDTLRINLLGTSQENTSGAIGVQVLDSTGTGVRKWLVSFTLTYQGAVVPPGDTTRVWLVNDAGLPSRVDTTDAQGVASRKVRYRVGTVVPPVDSAIVTAGASYRGAPLAGSPVQRVLPIRPKS